jgi:hypothetical protein
MFAEHKISTEGRDAVISPCGTWRYSLTRVWDLKQKRVLYCMLNPSVADGKIDDPTIRRCRNLAKQFRSGPYGSLEVVNLFAYRTAYPKELLKQSWEVRIGPDNAHYQKLAIARADLIILAYGAHDFAKNHAIDFIRMTGPQKHVHHLGLTKDRHPRHPLMVKADAQPVAM